MHESKGDRRKFLARAGVATPGVGTASLFASRAMSTATVRPNDVGVIQTALALEHEGIAAYRIAGKSGLLSPGTRKLALVWTCFKCFGTVRADTEAAGRFPRLRRRSNSANLGDQGRLSGVGEGFRSTLCESRLLQRQMTFYVCCWRADLAVPLGAPASRDRQRLDLEPPFAKQRKALSRAISPTRLPAISGTHSLGLVPNHERDGGLPAPACWLLICDK